MGRFELLVCSARNINAGVQKIGTPDPYVKVCVLDGIKKKPAIYKTAIRSNSLAPVWNEVFKFNVGDIDKVQVQVELWNDNVIKDDLLGSYELSLNTFERGVVKDIWVILKQTKLSTTELHLRGLAVDFGSSPSPGATVVNSLDNDSFLSRPTVPPPTFHGNVNGNWGSSRPNAMNQGPVIISTTNVFPNSGGFNPYPNGANNMPVPPHLMPQPASSGWMGGQQGPPPPPGWVVGGPPPPPGWAVGGPPPPPGWMGGRPPPPQGWMGGRPPPPQGWMGGRPPQQPSGWRSGPQTAQGMPPGAY